MSYDVVEAGIVQLAAALARGEVTSAEQVDAYLARIAAYDHAGPHLNSVVVLDPSPSLFACASGRAAGFLAQDWFPPQTAALGALSFRLHRELASEHDGGRVWGYAPSVAFSISNVQDARGARGEDWLFDNTSRARMAAAASPASVSSPLPSWLAPAPADVISSTETTAQV